MQRKVFSVGPAHGRDGVNMDRYECLVCGYIYDPEMGDSMGGIPPGVPFEELPADWVCPQCGAGKDQFVRVE